jgi:hypothetical protein
VPPKAVGSWIPYGAFSPLGSRPCQSDTGFGFFYILTEATSREELIHRASGEQCDLTGIPTTDEVAVVKRPWSPLADFEKRVMNVGEHRDFLAREDRPCAPVTWGIIFDDVEELINPLVRPDRPHTRLAFGQQLQGLDGPVAEALKDHPLADLPAITHGSDLRIRGPRPCGHPLVAPFCVKRAS